MDFIKKLPKTDLHVHLDGSVRIPTIIELSKERKLALPSYTEAGMMELVYKERYRDLLDYLEGFRYTIAIMQDDEALERIGYEFVMDNVEEGVRYVEVRFAPQFHMNDNLDFEHVMLAVNKGLEKATTEFNSRREVKSGKEPPFYYGIIICAMRAFGRGLSTYFDRFLDSHRYSPQDRVFSLAALELVQAAVKARDELGLPIVGFDLAGAEAGHPAEYYTEAYHYAHKHFLKKTVHAGEAYGPESIFQAITDLYADRIGHGYHLFDKRMITSKKFDAKQKEAYIKGLAQYIADRRVTIEVCLTSNLQTMPQVKSIAEHTFGKMLKAKLSTTFCTDNRTVSRTTVTEEIRLALKNFDINPRQLRHCIIYGFKRSFFPGTYLQKRDYVHSIIDYYEKVEQEWAIS
ncbi:MAG: adenosine deaminase [Deltaproteobacteria bacterium RIFOXYA12_FULL_61_11]|nr:MAG: adenosine deaminase [Deltaproteobacteria bacterium RIFOXYA12_FULL_61_11]